MTKSLHWMLAAASSAALGCGGPSTPSPTSEPRTATAGTEAASAEPAIGIPNEGRVDGLLVGGQPSQDALTRARDAGITTVISLRTPAEEGFEEERSQAEALGMRFISIPVDGAAGLTEDNAHRLDETLQSVEPAETLLHCGSGNRVGALLALRAFYRQQRPPGEALTVGRRAGLTRLESAVSGHFDRFCAENATSEHC